MTKYETITLFNSEIIHNSATNRTSSTISCNRQTGAVLYHEINNADINDTEWCDRIQNNSIIVYSSI